MLASPGRASGVLWGQRKKGELSLPRKKEECRRDFEKDDPVKVGGGVAGQKEGHHSESLEIRRRSRASHGAAYKLSWSSSVTTEPQFQTPGQ